MRVLHLLIFFLELYAVENNTSEYEDKICMTGIILHVHIMLSQNLGFCILIPKSTTIKGYQGPNLTRVPICHE